MRPSRLVARGFAAFRDEIEIDFTDVDFFALTGPTGAGKSSVIDAICFALYGSVPRYEHESLKAPVITTNAAEAHVELEFSRGTQRYRIVRAVRRNGNTKFQLDRIADDGSRVDTVTSSLRDAKQIVPAIVGLKFDEFTKCVVLPQGAFANLLHARDAARNELLTNLLDLGVYEEIARLADDREKQLGAEIAADERVLQELGAADEAAVDAASTRLAALQALYKEVDAGRTDAAALAERLATTRAELAAINRALAALEGVRVAPEVAEIAAERDALVARLRVAEAAHVEARTAVDAATAETARHPGVDSLSATLQAHRGLASIAASRAGLDAEHAARVAALEHAASAALAAEAELGAAQRAFDDCRDAHAAHALAARLVAGEPCPVCAQLVSSLDAVATRAVPAALEQADAGLRRAARAADTARAARTEADKACAQTATKLESLDAQRADLLAAVSAVPDVDAAEQALAAAEAAVAAIEDARKRAGAALDEETAARRAVASFDRHVEGIASAFHRQRDAVAAAGIAGTPVPSGRLDTDWTALHDWAGTAITDQRQRAAAIDASTSEIEGAARALVVQWIEPARTLGVELPREPTIDDVRDAVREVGIDARHDHQRLVEARDSVARVTEQLILRRQRVEVARVLRNHLRTTNFKSWLLARAVHALAARATERLLELSGGRYELALGDGDDFEVIDRANVGEHRPVRSLSGGETFQASLALALALAEQVSLLSAAGASSLESIFLDEGFGTLDPDALELVAGAVETLGGEGRMVGIVTHVGALAERVPVRFRVANDGRTATITREG